MELPQASAEKRDPRDIESETSIFITKRTRLVCCKTREGETSTIAPPRKMVVKPIFQQFPAVEFDVLV